MGILIASTLILFNFLLCLRAEQFGFWNSWLSGRGRAKLLGFLLLASGLAGAALFYAVEIVAKVSGLADSAAPSGTGLWAGLGGALLSRVTPGPPSPRGVEAHTNALHLSYEKVARIVDRRCVTRIQAWAGTLSDDDLLLHIAILHGGADANKRQRELHDAAVALLLSTNSAERIQGQGRLIAYLSDGYTRRFVERPDTWP